MNKMFVILMAFGVSMTFNACDGVDSSEPLVKVAKESNTFLGGHALSSIVRITALDNDIQILGVVGNRGNLSISCEGKTLQFGGREACHFRGGIEQLQEVQVKTNKGTWTFTW